MASLLCNARECPGGGRRGAGHRAIRIYTRANLARGLSSPCRTWEHPYPTVAIAIWTW